MRAPDCRALLEIVPGGPIGGSGFELTAERSEIVIGDQDESLVRLALIKGAANKRMTLARNDLANVQ
jgi:hypothetical protein